MKKIFLTLFLVLGSFTIQAQELTWETDINKAIAGSNKAKKPLLLFFTGSNWCGWCMRLQKEVLKTPEFAKWANQNVVLVELDYDRGGKAHLPEFQKQNMELLQLFAVQGYPTIWFTNVTQIDGKVNFEQLGKTGYVAGGPEAWITGANQILANKKS